MRNILFFLLVFIIINNLGIISSSCDSSEINVNTASLEDLDKLAGIGPVKAQAIIDSRPFNKLEDLINVVGIGEVTLANIKQQGIACIDDEEEDTEDEETINEEEEEEDKDEEEDEKNKKEEERDEETEIKKIESTKKTIQKKEEVKTIILNPKSIKTEVNKKELNKNKFAIYGLIIFCILLFFLFILEKRKNEKSEFK